MQLLIDPAPQSTSLTEFETPEKFSIDRFLIFRSNKISECKKGN